MEKIILKLSNGKISTIKIPTNNLDDGFTLIKNIYSVVSPGTEKMLINFGKQNIFQKIINNIDRVKLVLRKISEEGFNSTFKKVQGKLSQPIELGYSTCSEVVETSSKNLEKGDIVVTNGSHSDFAYVKNNLCVKVENKTLPKQDLAFAFIASISIHAFNISEVNKSHKVAVIGLGLIGALLTKYSISENIETTGFDISSKKIQNFKKEANAILIKKDLKDLDLILKNSFDVVYLCVENISTLLFRRACELLKSQGKVIIVGTTKAIFPRDIIYKKNLEIKVAVSYGPGRYDEKFETGRDIKYNQKFKYSYIDNVLSFIDKVKDKKINLDNLYCKKYSFHDFNLAYKKLLNNQIQGIIFEYDQKKKPYDHKEKFISSSIDINNYNCDIIGTGNHSSNIIIPKILKYKNTKIINLNSKNGISSYYINQHLKLNANVSSIEKIADNAYKNNYLFILSSHDSHFKYLSYFLPNKKKIFLEKPLCENLQQLNTIKDLLRQYKDSFHINFNRRYSYPALSVKEKITENKFLYCNYTIFTNAYLKENKSKENLKNMIIGELCHFIDLTQYFMSSEIVSYSYNFKEFNLSLRLEFINHNYADIHFFSCENENLSKENINIINGDQFFHIDNFKKLTVKSKNNSSTINFKIVDKGFDESIQYFFDKNIDETYISEILKNTEITIRLFEEIAKRYL